MFKGHCRQPPAGEGREQWKSIFMKQKPANDRHILLKGIQGKGTINNEQLIMSN
jgi:hypothetical protein